MRLLAEIRERVRALLFRRREDADLEEELAFHLDAATEANLRRGMTPHEARRQAMITTGGVEQIKEEVRDARGVRPLENLVRDLRFAVRRLIAEPGFSLPILASVALGTSVITAAFAMVYGVLLRPLPYPESDRLVEVRHAAQADALAVTGLSPGIFRHYRAHQRTLSGIAAYLESAATVTDAAQAPEQLRTALVSAEFFEVLRTTPVRGRFPGADPSAHPREVLIGHELWVRRYGADPAVVGRTIELDREPAMVVGIASPDLDFPHRETEAWSTARIEELVTRFGARAGLGSMALRGVGRLRDGVVLDEAEGDLNRLVATLPAAYPDVTPGDLQRLNLRAVVGPLKQAVTGDVRTPLWLLAATAAFLLLITWANATNLSLVRGGRLQREIAIRRALGATEDRIVQRFACEGALLGAGGGALGLVLASGAVGTRFGFAPHQIPRLHEVAVGGPAIGLAAAVAAATAGLLTVIALVSVRRSGGIPGAGPARVTAGVRMQAGRRLLVVGQSALALALLIGSALLAESYRALARAELGLRPDGALTFLLPLPPQAYPDRPTSVRLHADVLARLRAVPGVEDAEAATVAAFPLTPVPDYYHDRVSRSGADAADSAATPRALFSFATPGYFRALGIPLLAGRSFSPDAAGSSTEAVLSASLARAVFGDEDPVGQRVRSAMTGTDGLEVVGVVGDVPSRSLREGGAGVIYFASTRAGDSATSGGVTGVVLRDEQYVVRTALPAGAILPSVRRAIDAVDRRLVLTNVNTLDGLVRESLAPARVTMLLLAAGAATALVLGLIGIYGVLSYAVQQRRTELAVRIALGASQGGVVRSVVAQGAGLAVAGIAGGVIIAVATTRYLESLLYAVTPTEPAMFAGTAALLLGVSLLASYLPARRAGRIDPVTVLREDG